MASNYIERFIRIFVNNDAAVNDLKQTEKQLDKVDSSAKKLEKTMDNTSKSVLDNGGAVGILNELTGGLASTFKDATEAIQLTGVSLKGLRGAIIATGIGALVVIITELVSNWDKWSGVIDGSTSRLEELNTQLSTLEENYKDLTYAQQTMLDIMKLEGATMDEIAAKRRTNFDKAQALLIKQLETQKLIAAEAIKSATMWDRLTNGLLGNWDKVAEANKKVNEITRKLTKLTDDYYKAEKTDENVKKQQQIEASKKRQLQLDTERLDLLKKINDALRKESDIIVNLGREVETALAKYLSLGEIDDELTNLGKTFESVQNAATKYNKLLDELDASYKKIKNPTKEQTEAYEEERSKVEELVKTYIRFVESFDDLYSRAFKKGKDEIKSLSEKSAISSEVNALELEYLGLQNKIFDFENSYFDIRNGWSNTILDKEKNINDIYENRKKILDLTVGSEIKASSDKTKQYKEELDTIQGLYNVAQANAEREGATDRDLANALILKGKLLQAEKNYTQAVTEETALRETYQFESATLFLDKEAQIYDMSLEMYKNFIDQKKALDDEYYNNLTVTSSNVQGFLSALQDENLIRSKDLRNVLLVAEKGLAIANVVIETIRANNVLKARVIDNNVAGDSALAYALLTNDPRAYASAGLHYKAAGVATAGIALNTVSAGAAIGGILATTLTSWNRSAGGGGGSASGGGGGAPQFNIVGSSGTNQLAATIAAQQNQPVNAYVVGSDVSTQQSLDRNRVTNATFL